MKEQTEVAASLDQARKEWEKELAENSIKKLCVNCGCPIPEQTRGRPKKFCSDECRYRWKWKHPNVKNWKSARIVICPICGKEFLASRETPRPRKYCSHACANKARARKEGKEIETNSRTEGTAGRCPETGKI